MTTNATLLFNRFRPNTVAGRILSTLANGEPKTVAQIVRVAKPKSADNLLGPGGWYAKLRHYGKTSRKFTLAKTEDGKIVLRARKTRKAA